MHKFDTHRILYGHRTEITNYQLRVYGSPRVLAISDTEFSTEKAQAAIVLALHQALDPVRKEFHRTYLFVPADKYKWLCAQIEDMAKHLAKRLKKDMTTPEEKERGQKALRFLKEWIGQVHPGTPNEWSPTAPARWSAYGYENGPTLPNWIRVSIA